MFPPIDTVTPAAFNKVSVNFVTVLFPFDPVMPMIGRFEDRENNSISLIISIPADRASTIAGSSSETPGLTTRISALLSSLALLRIP